MVNISKRMHKLMPKLWRVKGGPGAAVLPQESSAPQLTSVVLRIPNPISRYDRGAHVFWRQFLPALRYHNLALPIKVEQKLKPTTDYAPTLTLQFEATTRDALEKQKAQPAQSDQDTILKWAEEDRQRRWDQDKAELEGGPTVNRKKDSRVDQHVTIPKDGETSIGAIAVKPQPAADPSAPSTTSPPATIYQRTVTLSMRGRTAINVWKWFQELTQAQPCELDSDERRLQRKQERFEVRAEKDRQLVKAGIETMRKEKEELRRAKEAAERLSSEV